MLPVFGLVGSSRLSTEWLLTEDSRLWRIKDGVVLLLLLTAAFGDVVALDDDDEFVDVNVDEDDGDDKFDESVDEFCSLDVE